ncbi:MAG TPA: bifunctional precorrin-2 dehydrogenase/sirohydrochlorin ferrochelatase [Chloroflexota bacterium]|nr:bifunctional precorrin-2 dehydrogenase/sirohydrochlorin ferrochelatase [Chloroflexota bacterium]
MSRLGVPFYPVFLDLLDKHVVVVGGGAVATSKVRGLLPCRPRPLVVIAPEVAPFIAQHAAAGALIWLRRAYAEGDLASADLAFGASDDRALNARVADEARRRGVPVLAVDDVAHCDFIAPAVVERGDLRIAISTGGRSPAMAARARRELERLVPHDWGALLDVAATARERLRKARGRVPSEAWQVALADPQLKRLVEVGRTEAAVEHLLERLVA